jgi:hypothetical protein
MLDLAGLFQWERFVTPSIIRVFYGLAVCVIVLMGLSGIVSGVALMKVSLLGGALALVTSVLGTALAILFVRIFSEFILVAFRINEHLGAIRDSAGV